ncbi:glutamine-hydrolyzing carbamoyl-phosphate synthase small subunit [Helicobacter cappadocius]|uniref:Carbamoyl phosphate synthase small chain n=1 Tax=Helicobacter cappadocius TaxID=3063998 RepID=A0AA90PJ58_9HELI|nr:MULTISPECIES: glutamine-hydrolyzing carbamoyl-phosphate synthase small subunit [unclassified Helicobacter]MDO7253348.1 glutamine-hydrolyzing carbamoyl-phosphate synthase small subunit [Helicobacter sp. faydin-H75]MDP2539222.1 glutamine-hydrolyzing carbamoyl-phosphate synthase small subunit [Helicobacter sp. faydin-H76]
MQDAYLYFENGLFLQAKAFGSGQTAVGEVVFNTSMTGYEEIITDPSYAGQFILFTMPEIGIVGANPEDMESRGIFCKGIIVRNYNEFYSNFRAKENLDNFLKSQDIMGITGVDTRLLTKTIRNNGSMMMIASTQISSPEELKNILKKSKKIQDINLIPEVSTPKTYTHTTSTFDFNTFQYGLPNTSKKIIAIDFGIKRNILNELTAVGLEVEVMPHHFEANSIIARFENGEIKGVFLSNGPGDPLMLKNEISQIKLLIEAKIPIFGICLGHQLLSIANGYETYKLKFGHHGGNHPVKNLITQSVEITSQNHNYSVPQEIEEIAEITHKNLFDGTIEGLKYKNAPIFSVQHHPEASPGPKESSNLFKQFADMI